MAPIWISVVEFGSEILGSPSRCRSVVKVVDSGGGVAQLEAARLQQSQAFKMMLPDRA